MGVITSGQTLTGKVGVAFSQTPAFTGTISSWALASGSSLPAGLSLNGTSGLISGTPTTKGSFSSQINYPFALMTVSAGFYYSLGKTETGEVVAWGRMCHGETIVPSGLSSVADIAAGGHHCLALKNDGSVVAWGENSNGECNVPSSALSGVIKIAAGWGVSLALKSNGTVIGWGASSTPPVGLTSVTDISATAGHYLALKSNGTVVGWGSNSDGQITIPSGLSGVVAIAAGGYHSLALKNDGTVVGWGYNDKNQRTIPSGLSGVVAIAGGDRHSLALKEDGTVVAWGSNVSGQTNTPYGLSNVVAISAGYDFSVAIKNDGAVVCWGSNYFNQCAPPSQTTSGVAFTITDGVPIITAGQTASGTVGAAFSKTFSLTDTTNRPVTSWAATGLPAGLSLNTTTGAITGTPQDSGSTSISLTATGPGGTGTATATISIAVGPPSIVAGQSFTGKVGVAFTSVALTLDDALDRPATSWSATGLPAGLSLNTTTGAITGTPTAKGSFTASFTATGGGGTSAARSIAFTIADGVPIITAGQTASGTVGAAFSKTFSLTDSTNRPVTSWAATGLPSWATLNTTTGAITGTPQDSGSATITLSATGPGGTGTATATISIAVGPPIITAGQSFTGKVGEAFTQTPALDDALDRPVTSWSLYTPEAQDSKGLPTGLSFNYTSGAITGTPTARGSFTASFTAMGPGGFGTGTSIAFTIADGVPIITAGQTASGTVGAAFSKTFSLTDSTNRRVTSWAATGLPSWATLNTTTGAITGTPQDSGSATITLSATGPGGTGTATATISIAVGPPIITAGQSFTGKVGVAFTQTPALDDALDRPATSWSATGLPAGLSLNTTTGAITGTPIAKGSFTASFTATGGGGTSAARSVAFTVADGVPVINAGQVLAGNAGVAFNQIPALANSANRPVTSWAATGLPGWATLNTTTGAITGAPQDTGSATITLTATGPGGTSPATTATISIAVGPPSIVAGQSFTGKVGVAFTSVTLTLDDALDRPATSWSATGLPAGLSLNTTTGAITGTPTAKGSFTASFTATGGGGTSAARSVAFTIAEGAPLITAQQLLFNELKGFSYLLKATDVSNRPVTSWSATGLPDWASLNSAGVLSGVAGSPGVYPISFTATGPGGVDTEQMQAIVLEYTPYVYLGTGVDGLVWRSVVNAGVPVHTVHGFMYGEFVLGAVGALDVLFYTTLNGRVTPQPLCGLGIKTYIYTFNPGYEAYRASTATALSYDFKSESVAMPVVKTEISCSGKSYGLYNIWGLPGMPDRGEVRAHISIQARP